MPEQNKMALILARIEVEGDCWIYPNTESRGYGRAMYHGKRWKVHRLVYEWLVGRCPEGLEADHLCRVKACCNPDHIEFVTHATNVRRGKRRSVCKQGHSRINTTPDGHCQECERIRSRDRWINTRGSA